MLRQARLLARLTHAQNTHLSAAVLASHAHTLRRVACLDPVIFPPCTDDWRHGFVSPFFLILGKEIESGTSTCSPIGWNLKLKKKKAAPSRSVYIVLLLE